MSNAQILIVEDEEFFAQEIRDILMNLDYGVAGIASTGEEAVQLTSELRPDLVLMDIVLKGSMDGVTAAEQIHEQFDIPVIYLTGITGDQITERAKITEPFGYILKPFQERELHVAIEIAIYKHKMERKLMEKEKELERLLVETKKVDMEELARSEERFYKVVDTANDAIISVDSGDMVVSWNRGAEKMFGYSYEEIINKPLFWIIPERFREGHLKGLKAYVETGKETVIGKTVELAGLRKYGNEFPLELSITAWDTKDGKFFTGIIRDITERKRSEYEIGKLNIELSRRATELELANEELESFSYSVSHDLSVPLRAIDGFLLMIQEDCHDGLDDECMRRLDTVRSSAHAMQRLIVDLLAFARMRRKEMMDTPVDMNELVGSVISELKLMWPQRSIQFKVAGMPPACGDRAMLHQVYFNLISNAIKFTRPIEDAVIELGGEALENETIYYVRDNGVGFDMADASLLFGVFQRLHAKSEFEGSGIGLALVHRIVRRHGGRVWAEGKVNEGATFYFTLPEKT